MLSCTHLCGNVRIVHCHRHTNSRPPECLCVGEDTMNLQWSSFPIWEIWIGGAVWSILVHVQCLHFCAKYKSVMRKGTFWRLIQNNFTSIWLHLGLNCVIVSLPSPQMTVRTVRLLGPQRVGKYVWGFGNWCLQTLNNNSAFLDS